MKQLLEDLISAVEYHVEQTRPIHSTTVALQAARETLKQEPRNVTKDEHDVLMKALAKSGKVVDAGFLAKQEQGEPVAIIHRNEYNEYRLEPHDNFDIKSIPFNVDVPLFKSPPQRAWVGLTDEQFAEACRLAENGNYLVAFQRIQNWIKENNT